MKTKYIILTILFISVVAITIIYTNNRKKVEQSGLFQLTATPSSLQNASSENQCIPPLEDFSYKLINSELLKPSVNFIVMPNNPWLPIADLSILDRENTSKIISIVRSKEGQTEIWIENYDYTLSKTEGFSIYNADINEFQEVDSQISDSPSLYVTSLFLQGESLWGQIQKEKGEEPNPQNYGILSKFDETKQGFVLEANTKNNFDNNEYMILVSKEMFWVLVNNNAIYNLDPITQQIKHYASIPSEKIQFATSSSGGDIYFIEYQSQNSQKEIYNFNVDTKTVLPVSLTYSVDLSYFTNIYVDKQDRLWVGGLGWRDSDKKTWNRIHPPSIFITPSTESGLTYWQNPFIVTESSDGRLWFRSDNGMAWLDLEKEQWCWFTTYQSNIVEDSDRNLWMIADNKLYKLPLGEQ